jgi:hypothetical protein
MTTDCLDIGLARRPAIDAEQADRHLRQAVLAAVISIVFVLPAAVGALALFG